MKKTKKKKTKAKPIFVFPPHAQMPDFKSKKKHWPPKFTHIGMLGFNSVPRNETDPNFGTPLPGHSGHHGFIIQWSAEGLGFGEFTFTQNSDGTMECETECSSPRFIRALLKEWIKRIVFTA